MHPILISILVPIISLGIVIQISRLVSHRELDDVHSRILDVDDIYLQKSKWLWVIPLYMDDPISNHPEWVARIKATGKKLGLHGVRHTHREFATDRSDEYIDEGIREFEKAFGFYPTHFKAPLLALSDNNRKKIEARGIKIKGRINQFLHNVYHSPANRTSDGKLIGE